MHFINIIIILLYILVNISKQHIFNYLSEMNISTNFNLSLWNDIAYLC